MRDLPPRRDRGPRTSARHRPPLRGADYVDEVDFDEWLATDDPNEVIEERETTIEGRRAQVIEHRSTGQALTPEGESSYTWAIDLDGQILVATTSSVGETDYERDKQVIDRMVTEELTIHDATATP